MRVQERSARRFALGPRSCICGLLPILLLAAWHPHDAAADTIDPPYTYVFFYDVAASVDVEGTYILDGTYAADSPPGSSFFDLRIAEPEVEHAETELAALILEATYEVGGVVVDLLFELEGHAHGTLERSGGQQLIDWYTVADDMRVTGSVGCPLDVLPCALLGLPTDAPVAIDTLVDADFTDLELTSEVDSVGSMSWVLPFIPEGLGQHTLTISGREQSSGFPLPLPEPDAGGLVAFASIVIGGLRRRAEPLSHRARASRRVAV